MALRTASQKLLGRPAGLALHLDDGQSILLDLAHPPRPANSEVLSPLPAGPEIKRYPWLSAA